MAVSQLDWLVAWRMPDGISTDTQSPIRASFNLSRTDGEASSVNQVKFCDGGIHILPRSIFRNIPKSTRGNSTLFPRKTVPCRVASLSSMSGPARPESVGAAVHYRIWRQQRRRFELVHCLRHSPLDVFYGSSELASDVCPFENFTEPVSQSVTDYQRERLSHSLSSPMIFSSLPDVEQQRQQRLQTTVVPLFRLFR